MSYDYDVSRPYAVLFIMFIPIVVFGTSSRVVNWWLSFGPAILASPSRPASSDCAHAIWHVDSVKWKWKMIPWKTTFLYEEGGFHAAVELLHLSW